ncbi:MAG: PAS domain S-box protein [Candidatus Thermoplasmatota archaeon]
MNADARSLLDPRINDILETIVQLGSGDLHARGRSYRVGDELDGIITGLNMIAEEWAAMQVELRSAENALGIRYSVIESSINAMVVADLEGSIAYVNPAFLDMYGYEDDGEIVGKFIETIGQMEVIMDALRSKGEWIGELTIKRKDGSILDVQVLANIAKDGNGEDTCMIFSFVDISERKRVSRRQSTAYRIADAANKSICLEELLRYIHQEIGELIDATNFYIALYDADTALLTFPYYVDETLPKGALVSGRKFRNGLTEYVIKGGRTLLATDNDIMQMVERGEIALIGALPLIWLGAPLEIEGRIIGVVAVQSYTNRAVYHTEDLEFLEYITSQIASTIERKRAEDALVKANKHLEMQIRHAHGISRALIDDVGFKRASGILYDCGWKEGMRELSPIRERWHGTAKEFAERYLDLCIFELGAEGSMAEFAEAERRARIVVRYSAGIPLDLRGITTGSYRAGFFAALISLAFGESIGITETKSIAKGDDCCEYITRVLEPYEKSAYPLMDTSN